MPTMIRKQVYVRPRQERLLKRLARQTGKTEAEIIREAIDQQAEELQSEQERLAAWRAERKFIEEWVAKGPAPGPVKRWTREELRER